MSGRQTTIAVYADKDRIYCLESQDCCRCNNFQTTGKGSIEYLTNSQKFCFVYI